MNTKPRLNTEFLLSLSSDQLLMLTRDLLELKHKGYDDLIYAWHHPGSRPFYFYPKTGSISNLILNILDAVRPYPDRNHIHGNQYLMPGEQSSLVKYIRAIQAVHALPKKIPQTHLVSSALIAQVLLPKDKSK